MHNYADFMKFQLSDYGNNIWKSPKYIEAITGVTKSSQIELNRKSRHGKETPPYLFSACAPNAQEVRLVGTGNPREYYFTEILFLALSEQFKINGIQKEILSIFLVYFQYHIEVNPSDSSLKLLKEKDALINFLDFKDKHIISNSKLYKDGDSENILWYFQIDSLVNGERFGSIVCENILLNKRGTDFIDRFNIFELFFKIPRDIESIHKLQNSKEPKLQPIEKYTDIEIASQIRFNLNTIHKKIKENTYKFMDK